MPDYTPNVTKEDIDRIARRDYSSHTLDEIWGILKGYGYGEAYRVYAAALKEGKGDAARLRDMIDLANLDYRDLLVAAEYPAQAREGIGYHRPEIYQADKKQYYDWFGK